jgi:hypothetical protein
VRGRRGGEALDRGDHRRDRRLHVRRAAAIQVPGALGRRERLARPLLDGTRRHDVHMAGETDDRPACAVHRPQVARLRAVHPLADESGWGKTMGDQVEAPVVERCDRPAGDQLLRQVERVVERHVRRGAAR